MIVNRGDDLQAIQDQINAISYDISLKVSDTPEVNDLQARKQGLWVDIQTELDQIGTNTADIVDIQDVIDDLGITYLETNFSNGIAATANINMGNNKIINCAEVDATTDLVLYAGAGNVKITNSALLMTGNRIGNLGDGLLSSDAATIGQITSSQNDILGQVLELTGGVMEGLINMDGFQIENLGDPVDPGDAVNKQTLVNTVGDYLLKSGGVMTGGINMSSNSITNVAYPTLSASAANKQYVDDIASGLNVHNSVDAATPAALDSCVYADGPNPLLPGVGATLTATANGDLSGSSTIDSYVITHANTYILVKNQAAQLQNGIYVVTDQGSDDPAGSPWILTR